MREEFRTRFTALVVLVAVGAVLGAAGSALGVGGPVEDPAATFVVEDGNVTVSDGDERATVVDRGAFDAVEIEQTGDGFRVVTEQDNPLSVAQRERAKHITRENGTVRGRVAALDEYELAVEPVTVLETAQYDVVGSMDVSNDTMNVSGDGAETSVFRVENYTVTERDGSVTVESDDSYADDLAVVEVRRPGSEESVFSAHVDLENETVTRIAD